MFNKNVPGKPACVELQAMVKKHVQKSAREESWFNEKKMKKYNISTTEFFVHFARIFFLSASISCQMVIFPWNRLIYVS